MPCKLVLKIFVFKISKPPSEAIPATLVGEFDIRYYPSKIEWDLTNGPLSKLLELLDTQVFSGSVQWVLLEISWILESSLDSYPSNIRV